MTLAEVEELLRYADNEAERHADHGYVAAANVIRQLMACVEAFRDGGVTA